MLVWKTLAAVLTLVLGLLGYAPATQHAAGHGKNAGPIPSGTCWLWKDMADDATSVPAGAGPTPVTSGNLDTLDIRKGGIYTDGTNLTVVMTLKTLSGVGGLPISDGDQTNPAYVFYKFSWNNANGHPHFMIAAWADPVTVQPGLNPPNVPSGAPSPSVEAHTDGWYFYQGYTYSNQITWDATTADVKGTIDMADNAIIMTTPLNAIMFGDSTGMNFQPDPIKVGDVLTNIQGVSHQGAFGSPMLAPADIYWTAAIDGDGPDDNTFGGWKVQPTCKILGV